MSPRTYPRSTPAAVLLGVIALHVASGAAGARRDVDQMSSMHEVASLDEAHRIGLSVLTDDSDGDDGVYVLFVHGINGSPRDFQFLVDALDRRRYRICVFHYTSDEALDRIARELVVALAELSASHRVRSVAIVAHSMGGLIARHLLVDALLPADVSIPLLVTLSTPWEGNAAASLGARFVPSEPVWRDIATGSDYLADLFQGAAGRPKQLPAGTQHHLLFSYRKSWIAPGPSGDRVVSVASQLGDSAQEQATRIYGFDVTHVGILKDPAVAALLTRLLERTYKPVSFELALEGAPD